VSLRPLPPWEREKGGAAVVCEAKGRNHRALPIKLGLNEARKKKKRGARPRSFSNLWGKRGNPTARPSLGHGGGVVGGDPLFQIGKEGREGKCLIHLVVDQSKGIGRGEDQPGRKRVH